MTVSIQRLNHWYQSTLFSTRSLNLHKSYPLPPHHHHHFTSLWKHIYFPNPSFPGLFVFNLNFLAYLFAQVPFFFFLFGGGICLNTLLWRQRLLQHPPRLLYNLWEKVNISLYIFKFQISSYPVSLKSHQGNFRSLELWLCPIAFRWLPSWLAITVLY